MNSRSATIPVYSDQETNNPPIVLVHGAANSAQVWRFWQSQLAADGWSSHAVDLRGHGQSSQTDLSGVRMEDYAADVRAAARRLARPAVIMGWSMGGLVAMMVASEGDAMGCIALEPSVPAERVDHSIAPRAGVFGPEEYGITSGDPEHQPMMRDLDLEERRVALDSLGYESRYARDQRKAGIAVGSLPCPLLIISGTTHSAVPRKSYDSLGLDADFHVVEGASHWGLVLSRRALSDAVPHVAHWLSTKL